MLKRGALRESGYTLIEVVISATLMTVTIGAFSLFINSVGEVQVETERGRVAQRVLDAEAEMVYSTSYDDLMLAGSPTNSLCAIDSERRSRRSIPDTTPDPTNPDNPARGPIVRTLDRVPVTITYAITWAISNGNVTCDPGSNNRPEAKKIVISASWDDGYGNPSEDTRTIIRSRFTEQSGDVGSRGSSVKPQYSSPNITNSATWCQAYSNDYITGSAGRAYLNGTSWMNVALTAANNLVCGLNVANLQGGTTYTAIMTVVVPSGQDPVALGVSGMGSGGLAPDDGQPHILTYTWVQPSDGNALIGPTRQASITKPLDGSVAIVQSVAIVGW